MFKMMESLIASFRGSSPRDREVAATAIGAATRTTGDAAPLADDNVVDALRRILARRDPTPAGSIHLMGLDSLADRLGSHWPAIADRVHLLTIHLLNQYLSPSDTWFRQSGDTYVVVFAHLAASQAEIICNTMVEELQRLLLGSTDTDSIKVRASVHQIGSDTLSAPSRLNRLLQDTARTLSKEVAANEVPEPSQPGIAARSIEEAGPLQVCYRPVWDVKQQVVSVFIARACRQRYGRAPLWAYECLENPEDPNQILNLDIQVIEEAVNTALELYDNRFRFFLSVPIHFESLAVQARRRALLSCLQAIPAHMRPLMTYHLYGLPTGIPVGRLAEMVSILRPLGRTTMVVVDPADHDLKVVAEAGAKVACILLPPGAGAQRHRADLLRFGMSAAKNRLCSSVEGVGDLNMEHLCEDAQITFLSGDLIGGWIDTPQQAVRRHLEDFSRPRMAASA